MLSYLYTGCTPDTPVGVAYSGVQISHFPAFISR